MMGTSTKKIKYKINYEIFPEDYSKVCYGDTDSVFMILKTPSYDEFTNLKEVNEELKGKLMKESFDEGKRLADEISFNLFKNPIKLEFEKVYYPLILFSKKRYIGNYYGTSPDKIDFTENKGIVLKRRDNPDIVKRLYREFIEPILEKGKPGIEKAVEKLKDEIVKVITNKHDINELIVTKSIGKSYAKERCGECDKPATRKTKKGNKEVFSCKTHTKDEENSTLINAYASENSPHIALCKKIADRDPGNAPVSGDRINYVFVKRPDIPKAKLFEKAEEPKYAIENNMEIDVDYYINNQLKKPLSELLQFMIKDHDVFFDNIIKEQDEIKKGKTIKYIGAN